MIADLNNDGVINCQDWVIKNIERAVTIGAEPTVRTRNGNHVYVTFERFNSSSGKTDTYFADNDRLFVLRGFRFNR